MSTDAVSPDPPLVAQQLGGASRLSLDRRPRGLKMGGAACIRLADGQRTGCRPGSGLLRWVSYGRPSAR